MSRVHLPSLAALVVAVASLVACSSGSTGSTPTTTTVMRRGSVPVAVWSSRVCRGFDRWINELDAQAQAAGTLVRGAPPATARTAVIGLFEEGGRSSRAYRASLRRAGAPAVERGLDLQAALIRRVDRVDRIMATSRRQAASLPVTDAARFQLALAELVNTHESAIISATRSFDRFDDQIDDPELRSALSVACGS